MSTQTLTAVVASAYTAKSADNCPVKGDALTDKIDERLNALLKVAKEIQTIKHENELLKHQNAHQAATNGLLNLKVHNLEAQLASLQAATQTQGIGILSNSCKKNLIKIVTLCANTVDTINIGLAIACPDARDHGVNILYLDRLFGSSLGCTLATSFLARTVANLTISYL